MSDVLQSDQELLRLQVEALFTHDIDGRIRSTNEPNGRPAPRFFLSRSNAGNLWRYRYDLPAALVQELEHLALAEPVVADLRTPPVNDAAFRRLLEAHRPIQQSFIGPAYAFPEVIAEPAGVITLSPSEADMLRPLWPNDPDLHAEVEARQPCIAILEGSSAAAICFCARITSQAAEAGVETLQPYRGRGYASAVVAAWALAIRRLGRIPLYSTSWDNVASQGVARRLGLRMYGVDFSLS